MDLGPYVRTQLRRAVPPHQKGDYVSYPKLIATQLILVGYVREVGVEENAEIDSDSSVGGQHYIPHGTHLMYSRKD